RAAYRSLRVQAPSYQAPNVAVAVAAAEEALGAPLEATSIRDALAQTRFPGRFQVLRETPFLVIDGAHNPEAAHVLAGAVREAFGAARPVFVLGVMADKDVSGIVSELIPVSSGFVCTASRSPRAMDPQILAEVVAVRGGAVLGVARTVPSAVRMAETAAAAGIVAAGSIYVAGEVLAAFGADMAC
ncbi:MAG: cyanophycin synthetase, partial [Coriobacteriales bacterium]